MIVLFIWNIFKNDSNIKISIYFCEIKSSEKFIKK